MVAKRKILIVHANATSPLRPIPIGGAEVTVAQLAGALRDGGRFDVTVASVSDEVSTVIELEKDGLQSVIFPIKRPSGFGGKKTFFQKAWWHLLDDYGAVPDEFGNFVRDAGFSVALLHNLSGFGWRVAKILNTNGVASILTIHDYYYICARMNAFVSGENCSAQCFSCGVYTTRRKDIFNYVQKIVFVSQEMIPKFEGVKTLNPSKVVVINNAVDSGRVDHFPRDWTETRYGFIGRNAPEKGLDLLIQAIARLPSKAKLVVGGGFSVADQVALTAGLDVDVEFLGFCRPEELFAKVDVLAVPSLWEEPFGRVVIEALAAGVPSVVSSHGGLPTTVLHGETGWIVPGDTVQDWVLVLGEIDKSSPDFAEKVKNFGRGLDAFSLKRYISSYYTLLEDLFS